MANKKTKADRLAQELLGIDESVKYRAAMLPLVRTKDDKVQIGYPSMLIDALNAAMLPGHVLSGGDFTEEDVRNMAFNLGGGGAVAGRTLAPKGAIAMGASGGKNPSINYSKVAKKTAKSFKNKAQKKIASELAMRPDLPDVLSRAEGLSQASQRSGIKLTLPEMIAQSPSDQLLMQQGKLVSNPMTSGRMEQLYAARNGSLQGQGQIEQQLLRLAQQLDPNVGSYDDAARSLIGAADEAQKGITQKLSARAAPLYEKAYQASIPDSDEILQNPLIQSALQKARNNPVFAQEIGDLPDNSIQALNVVKINLDDMAQGAPRNEARLINKAKTQLVQRMDEVAPEYAQARQIYSGNPEALQMRQTIGGLADIDPLNAKSVDRALYGGTQQNADLAAQALGAKAPTAVSARIYNAMDTLRNPLDPATGQATQLGNRIAPDNRTLEMLRAYGAPKELEETLGVINQAKLGDRYRMGSPTDQLQTAGKQMSAAAGEAANAAMDVASGGATAVGRIAARQLAKGKKEVDPQFYADMADLMLTDQGMDLLRKAAAGQKAAINQIEQWRMIRGAIGDAATVGAGAYALSTANEEKSVIFKQPNEDKFNEFDRILQQQHTPQQQQKFNEFDKILQGAQ